MKRTDTRTISETALPGVRVLIVEDNVDTAIALARLLRHFGHTIKIAGSVQLALSLVCGEKFDVIVSDITLPDGTGYELMKQIKQQTNIQGIAMSGWDNEEAISYSKAAGFARHLVKPVSVSGLDSAIRQLVK